MLPLLADDNHKSMIKLAINEPKKEQKSIVKFSNFSTHAHVQ